MLTVPSNEGRVFVRPRPTDMRKQINGLAVLVEQELELSPFSEAVFLFCNRERRILRERYSGIAPASASGWSVPAASCKLYLMVFDYDYHME